MNTYALSKPMLFQMINTGFPLHSYINYKQPICDLFRFSVFIEHERNRLTRKSLISQ